MRRFFVFFVAMLFCFFVRPAAASHPQTVTVRLLSKDWAELSTFQIPTANAISGVSIATGDLGTDGIDEIIVGNGLGNEPRVHAYRTDGSEIGSFLAYDSAMGVGVHVAVCDLDGDRVNEIVTVPDRGGAPHVRVFNNFGALIDPGFFAYDEMLTTGVNLACGDLDADGTDELITLPAVGGGSHVRVWNRKQGEMKLSREFFVFNEDDTRGLVGTIHNGQLRVSAQLGNDHTTYSYKLSTDVSLVSSISSTDDANAHTGMFSDGDRTYITTTNGQMIDVDSFTASSVVAPFGAINATTLSGGTATFVIADARPIAGGSLEEKSIVIDLSEQRLYAYKNSLLDNSFLVSTARSPWTTPLGTHKILAKVPLVHYAGGSGADAYDLGWVPYNLRFYPHIYIHYAPWHNNFGHTMSHGCVNVNLENIKWIYEWAEENISVTVQS